MAAETVSDLIKNFRDDEKDTIEPFFWSDSQLVRFFNQALTAFAEKTRIVIDDSSDITAIDFSAGQALLSYSPQIIDVIEAVVLISGRTRKLDVMTPGGVSRAAQSSAGCPRIVVLDESAGSLRLYPVPSFSGQLLLTVVRRPLKELVKSDRIQDVPAHNRHILLLDMKHYAYRIADGELFDPAKAINFSDEFNRECQSIYEAALLRRAGSSSPTRFRWLS